MEYGDINNPGSWTPTVDCSISGSYGVATNADTATYYKIGRLVFISGSIHITSAISPVGNLQISLPFTSAPSQAEDSGFTCMPVLIKARGTSLDGQIQGQLGPNDNVMLFIRESEAGAESLITNANVDTNFYILLGGTYLSAE